MLQTSEKIILDVVLPPGINIWGHGNVINATHAQSLAHSSCLYKATR